MSNGNESLLERLGITEEDRRTRLRWVGIADSDIELIRAAAVHLRPEAEQISKEFYDHSFRFPVLNEKLNVANSNRARLEAAQADYFKRLLDANYDGSYIEFVARIGLRHAELDVKPRWNLGNYSTYAQLIFPRLAKTLKGQALLDTVLAFQKVFTLDGSMAVETYLSGLMDRMVDVNTQLAPAAATVATGTSQVELAAREIASAVQQIARGASDQTSQLGNAQTEMDALGEAVSRVSAASVEQATGVTRATETADTVKQNLGRVSEQAERAGDQSSTSLEDAEAGMRSVDETISAMDTINSAVVSTASQISELSANGKEIDAITRTISEIADQTNLLALNAAIEAARAGEAGRGFAVVAEEVRSLAERASSAAKDIATLIQRVQAGMARSEESMNGAVGDVESGAEKARDAGDALRRIVDGSRELSTGITEIAGMSGVADRAATEMMELVDQVGQQATSTSELAVEMEQRSTSLTEVVSGVTAVAEESAASAEQVSASTEEVTAQIGEMAGQADSIGALVEELTQFLVWIGALNEGQAARQAA
jgi:methyl-accepting chemotaxis protein